MALDSVADILTNDPVVGAASIFGGLVAALTVILFLYRRWRSRGRRPDMKAIVHTELHQLASPPIQGQRWQPYPANHPPKLPLSGTKVGASLEVVWPSHKVDTLAVATAPIIRTESYRPSPACCHILWPPPVGGGYGAYYRRFAGVGMPGAGAVSFLAATGGPRFDYYDLTPGSQEFFLGDIWFGAPGIYKIRLGIRGCVRGKGFTAWSTETHTVVVPSRWEAWGADHRNVAVALGEGVFPEGGRVEDLVDKNWYFTTDDAAGETSGVGAIER